MKRNYVKPFLLVEPYQLLASVAACSNEPGGTPIYYSETTCDYGGGYFFSSQCDEDVVNGDCYHGPFVSDGLTFIMS